MRKPTFRKNYSFRTSFAKMDTKIQIPNLVDIQRESYKRFLQSDARPEMRYNSGLQAAFLSVFPIKDYNETAALEFLGYNLQPPKYEPSECRMKGTTFAAPLKIMVRMVIWDKNKNEDGGSSIREIKEHDVVFGEIPLMTNAGTFVINGNERVVVSQLHRCPGVFFDSDRGLVEPTGKVLYSARIIPNRGAWLDFEFEKDEMLYCRIDRRRKFLAVTLLQALGYTGEEILNYYYLTETLLLGETYQKRVNFDSLLGFQALIQYSNELTNKVIAVPGMEFTRELLYILKLEGATCVVPVPEKRVLEHVLAKNVYNPKTGEVIAKCNEVITKQVLEDLYESEVHQVEVLCINERMISIRHFVQQLLMQEQMATQTEALLEIFRIMKPTDIPTVESARELLNNLFFNPSRYDLSEVGRLKFNFKLNKADSLSDRVLSKSDILDVLRYLLELSIAAGIADDIDNLENRRVRGVGELVENQYRIGLVRMEKAARERMSMHEIEGHMAADFINSRSTNAALKEFFGSSALSQFMDQTNPLAEITHKRRLSALGPGGLSRERAGFEVRDVHCSHYGRLCPVETPEGQNIGLVASLAVFAQVNRYGFIQTPYRFVKDGAVTSDISYFSPLLDGDMVIAPADTRCDSEGKFIDMVIEARQGTQVAEMYSSKVELMDVSRTQLFSSAAALIPFIEHNDANRALMGSNMQRQAVPLLRPEFPLVGTGMELNIARDSGASIINRRDGIVIHADARRIVVKPSFKEYEKCDFRGQLVDVYKLDKFRRSNQNTCYNQQSRVHVGEYVRPGELLADGACINAGEIALGRNVVVAFMTWYGYNFEDSILVSDRVIKDDAFTSLHIEEFECLAKETKAGQEEFTSDLMGFTKSQLENIDSCGIVKLGSFVRPGDVLVAKITPRSETQLTPEEKLLRAIFGDKAGEVDNTSMFVPSGVAGTVTDVRILTSPGSRKCDRTLAIEQRNESLLLGNQNNEINIITKTAKDIMIDLLEGEIAINRLLDEKGKVVIKKGDELTQRVLQEINWKCYSRISLSNILLVEKIKKISNMLSQQIGGIKANYAIKLKHIRETVELPAGVLKLCKIYITMRRRLQVGDKLAGRHGNKGVVSKILPEGEMPYLPDGTPVDFVLSPLGVPSRMNIGQVLEAHLGWGIKKLGMKFKDMHNNKEISLSEIRNALKESILKNSYSKLLSQVDDDQLEFIINKIKNGVPVAVPAYNGNSEKIIQDIFSATGIDPTGQTPLFDGRTGKVFDQDITVGVLYMLKLNHLSEDKIHARSVGPYSLITQQPLGGKAQFGGQRLGEMEVWALEAYGVAYMLKEFLTVKSDDVLGRTKMYEAIIKGEHILTSGVPESFNVLIKELQSLGLNVQLLNVLNRI